jgi:NADH:ubiquinone oxidoreductase subunit K
VRCTLDRNLSDRGRTGNGLRRRRLWNGRELIVFFVITVAAAEAAVGLAIVIALFRHKETLSPDAFTSLKW